MTAATPWKLIKEHGKDIGSFIVDARGDLVDIRRDGNGQLIVDAVNKMVAARAREASSE